MARASVTNVPVTTTRPLLEVDARGASVCSLSLTVLTPAESDDDLWVRVQACSDREEGSWSDLTTFRTVGDVHRDCRNLPIAGWGWVRVLAVRGDGPRVPRVSGVLQTEP